MPVAPMTKSHCEIYTIRGRGVRGEARGVRGIGGPDGMAMHMDGMARFERAGGLKAARGAKKKTRGRFHAYALAWHDLTAGEHMRRAGSREAASQAEP